MYTVSLLKGYKTLKVHCDSLEAAVGVATSCWHLEPSIIDEKTGLLVAFDLNTLGMPESEY